MNSLCAFAFPSTNLPKSSSLNDNVTVGLSPRPLLTSPFVLRSMFQLSVSPALFLRVKAKIAAPCLMASFLSFSVERAEFIASKAAEEGKDAVGG